MSTPRESLTPAFKGVLEQTQTGWELKQKSCKLSISRGQKNRVDLQQSGKCGGLDLSGTFYEGEGE